jgi:cell volume regulation protein A
LQLFLQKISSGLMIGVILGYLARFGLEKLVNQDEELLILGVAIALLSYGAAEMLGGSGFISAYVTGMFMSNHVYRNLRISPNRLLQAMLPFNTMTEITVFLIFGLAMDPSKLLASLPEGIAVALAMMVVARPLSVLVFQWCSPFSLKEALLLSWCGLRGAVPLALSISMLEAIQHLRGVEPALVEPLINNTEVIVFCAVVLNLLIQGFSLVPLARYLKLGPEPAPGPAWPRSD